MTPVYMSPVSKYPYWVSVALASSPDPNPSPSSSLPLGRLLFARLHHHPLASPAASRCRRHPSMALLRLHLPRPLLSSRRSPALPSALSASATSCLWRGRLPASRLLCSSHPALAPDASSAAPPSIVAGLLDYLNESWTQFHATGSSAGRSPSSPPRRPHARPMFGDMTPCYRANEFRSRHALTSFSVLPAEAKRQLLDAGFKLLSESDDWDLQPGGRYFFTRNMSCLVAFAIGEKSVTHLALSLYHYHIVSHLSIACHSICMNMISAHIDRHVTDCRYRVGNGFNIIAAHTDSPCLKLKPRSATIKSGHQMVNVQTYGSGLWHTWFDRDLTLAGRLILKATDGSFKHELVKLTRPLIRVPTLAIHLNRLFPHALLVMIIRHHVLCLAISLASPKLLISEYFSSLLSLLCLVAYTSLCQFLFFLLQNNCLGSIVSFFLYHMAYAP
jgi:hypothetical protein